MADDRLWVPGQPDNFEEEVMRALARGRTGQADDSDDIAEMRKNRRVNARRAIAGNGSSPSVSLATGRPHDPMFYWKQNNLPYEVDKPDELKKIRSWCRAIYLTDPVIASAIDVMSKFPLVGMEFRSKDKSITDFYSDQFMEDGLNYEEFAIDIGREYWMVGEAFPLGSFSETLGIWEDEELLNPDDIEVIISPFLREPRFETKLPQILREILEKREPVWEYQMLMRSYPELSQFLGKDQRMPVSSILLRQLKFKADTFHPRGLPLLMRAFRAAIQEEMLNAAQDAIADRLYTPLILAKLGASASDLGTNRPWVPTDDEIADFEVALDAALASDFRVLTHNFALDLSSVFGREAMPNFGEDFNRLTDKKLMAFGMSRTMLAGGQAGETYAADAINFNQVAQLLSTFQRLIKRHTRQRALVVAEAQQHYDYEIRGGKRYPIMEEVLERDEETGEQHISRRPKLLVPDMILRNVDMQDERDMRQFVEAAVAAGVPISMKTRLVNVPVDLEEEQERAADEQVEMAVAAQRVRKRTYERLVQEGLPIPEDLMNDFGPKAVDARTSAGQVAAPDVVPTTLGNSIPAPTTALAPTTFETDEAADAEQDDPTGEGVDNPNVIPLSRNKARPPESDEQRARMPKPAIKRTASGEPYIDPVDPSEVDVDRPGGLISGPSHIGRRLPLTSDTVLPDDPTDDIDPTAS